MDNSLVGWLRVWADFRIDGLMLGWAEAQGGPGWVRWEGRVGLSDEGRVGCSDGRVNDITLLGRCLD